MSNFKPGNKAIYVGPPVDGVTYGDEVEILKAGPTCEYGGRLCRKMADYVIDIGGGYFIFAPAYVLRKPDTYDITEQEWYQRIIQGKPINECV